MGEGVQEVRAEGTCKGQARIRRARGERGEDVQGVSVDKTTGCAQRGPRGERRKKNMGCARRGRVRGERGEDNWVSAERTPG